MHARSAATDWQDFAATMLVWGRRGRAGMGACVATSAWRAERNEKARARLMRHLPDIFPAPVLIHALKRPFIPPTPRRAIEAYWRNHPVRADKLARALAAQSGAPAGWSWRIAGDAKAGLPASFRAPPA